MSTPENHQNLPKITQVQEPLGTFDNHQELPRRTGSYQVALPVRTSSTLIHWQHIYCKCCSCLFCMHKCMVHVAQQLYCSPVLHINWSRRQNVRQLGIEVCATDANPKIPLNTRTLYLWFHSNQKWGPADSQGLRLCSYCSTTQIYIPQDVTSQLLEI